MPGYRAVNPVAGAGPFNELLTPDTTQRFALGQVIDAVDSYFGFARFVYLMTPTSTAIAPGRLVTIKDETFVVQDIPNTANTGYPVFVARQNIASNAANQYAWFQTEGLAPVQAAASVAQGVAVGVGAAGKAGTNSAGKQLLGMSVLEASTFTLTKTVQTVTGSAVMRVSSTDGLFVGLTPSGSGIAAGTISALDPSGTAFTDTANATATASVTGTFTYTNFLLVYMQNCHVQGAIT
jgi:hypothetical protein